MRTAFALEAGREHRGMVVLLIVPLALAGCSAKSPPVSRESLRPSGSPALASSRVEGEWKITLTVTELTGELLDRRQGDVVERRWTFTPKCATGPCELILKRQTPVGTFLTTPVTLDGANYEAKELGEPIVCSAPDKSAVFDQGLKVRVSIRFHVEAATLKNRAALATRIAGTATTDYVPTSEAAAGGCKAFVEKDTLVGEPAS